MLWSKQGNNLLINAFSQQMQYFKIIRLIASFYRNCVLFSILITVICISLYWRNGLESLMAICWFKIATLALTYYFMNSYNQQRYYYYMNLGISKAVLWTVSLLVDFAFFISLLILIYHIKWNIYWKLMEFNWNLTGGKFYPACIWNVRQGR